jgi:hypothetical protein
VLSRARSVGQGACVQHHPLGAASASCAWSAGSPAPRSGVVDHPSAGSTEWGAGGHGLCTVFGHPQAHLAGRAVRAGPAAAAARRRRRGRVVRWGPRRRVLSSGLSRAGACPVTSSVWTKRPRTSLRSVSWVAAGRERRCVRSGRVLDLGVGCHLPGGPNSGQPTVDPLQEHARQPMPAGRSPKRGRRRMRTGRRGRENSVRYGCSSARLLPT